MKITCDEATTICDKSQYKEASLWEIIKLKVHLILCKHCGKYSNQNGIMTKCYEKQRAYESLKNKSLCNEDKEEMERAIKEKI